MIHLGPARSGAKRYYSSREIESSQPSDVAYLLRERDNKYLINLDILNKTVKDLNLLEAIDRDFGEDPKVDITRIIVKPIHSDNWVNLCDTGYGMSQLMPIIFNAISNDKNMILVQQPETHLHPKLQADVGKIMVDSLANKSNHRLKTWIVETHSETILLRILKMIRQGVFDSNMLRVYYIDKNIDGESIIKRMRVSSSGELVTHWPDGFFSTDLKEMF